MLTGKERIGLEICFRSVLLSLAAIPLVGAIADEHEVPAKGQGHAVVQTMSPLTANELVASLKDFNSRKLVNPGPHFWRGLSNLLASSDPCLLSQQQAAQTLLEGLPADLRKTYGDNVPAVSTAFKRARDRDDPEAMLTIALNYPGHPTTDDALNWLGTYYLNRGDFGKAYAFLRKMVGVGERIAIKLALAAHQMGDRELKTSMLKLLRARKASLKVGKEVLDAEGIEAEINEVDAQPEARLKEYQESIAPMLEKPYAAKDARFARWLARSGTEALMTIAARRTTLSMGVDRMCTNINTEVACWKEEEDELHRVEFRKNVLQLSSTSFHTCALLADNTTTCWPTTRPADGQTRMNLWKVRQLSAGGNDTCAIYGEYRQVACWRDGEQPAAIEGATFMRELATGSYHTCGVRERGSVHCWPLPPYALPKSLTPPKELKDVTAIASGLDFSCAVMKGKPHCWGEDSDKRTEPPSSLEDVVSLSLGSYHACALTKAKKVVCWGGEEKDRKSYQPPPGLIGVKRLVSHSTQTCAETPEGVVCWGKDMKKISRSGKDLLPRPGAKSFLGQIAECGKATGNRK